MAGESARDQCSKEGCYGCKHCNGGYVGAFDNSYDDSAVELHEENKIRAKYEKPLSEYSTDELKSELKKRIILEIDVRTAQFRKELEEKHGLYEKK